MSWSNKQKAWIKQVLKVANVSDESYRETLVGLYSNCTSATDERLNAEDFARVMAWAEWRINEALVNGICSLDDVFKVIADPWQFNRKLRNKEFYKNENSTPKKNYVEKCSQDQINKIIKLKHEIHSLGKLYDLDYFNGIISHATKEVCNAKRLDDLMPHQASYLIDALQEKYEILKFERDENQRQLDLIPF